MASGDDDDLLSESMESLRARLPGRSEEVKHGHTVLTPAQSIADSAWGTAQPCSAGERLATHVSEVRRRLSSSAKPIDRAGMRVGSRRGLACAHFRL
jgi:hypothetical protein